MFHAAPSCTMPTLYVNNLNDKVRLPKLKSELSKLFSEHGSILLLTAHSNLKMKGQAFITFENELAADHAQKALQGYTLFGKKMNLAMAKSESDSFHQAMGDTDAIDTRKTLKREREIKLASTMEGKTPLLAEPKKEEPKKKRKLNNPVSSKLLVQNVSVVEDDEVNGVVSRWTGYKSHKMIKARKVIIIEFVLDEQATEALADIGDLLGAEVIVDYGK